MMWSRRHDPFILPMWITSWPIILFLTALNWYLCHISDDLISVVLFLDYSIPLSLYAYTDLHCHLLSLYNHLYYLIIISFLTLFFRTLLVLLGPLHFHINSRLCLLSPPLKFYFFCQILNRIFFLDSIESAFQLESIDTFITLYFLIHRVFPSDILSGL